MGNQTWKLEQRVEHEGKRPASGWTHTGSMISAIFQHLLNLSRRLDRIEEGGDGDAKQEVRWSRQVGRLRASAQQIVSLLTGPRVKPSELSEAEGRAEGIAHKLAEIRRASSTDSWGGDGE